MDCKRVSGLLSECAAGELDGETSAQVNAHVSSCPGCATVLDEYRRALAALRAAAQGAPEASPAFFNSLAKRIDAVDLSSRADGAAAASRRYGRPLIRWHFVTGIAAAAAAVLVISVYFWPSNVSNPGAGPVTVADRTGDRTAPAAAPNVVVAVPDRPVWPATYRVASTDPVETPGRYTDPYRLVARKPRFVFPDTGLPIGGTKTFSPGSNSVSLADFQRLEARVSELERKVDALKQQGGSTDGD